MEPWVDELTADALLYSSDSESSGEDEMMMMVFAEQLQEAQLLPQRQPQARARRRFAKPIPEKCVRARDVCNAHGSHTHLSP
jgi:hypothetical protein